MFTAIDQPTHKPNVRELWKRRVRNEREIYVRAIGTPRHVQIEPEREQSRVDHVWMMMDSPPTGRLIVSINTLSIFNRNAGYDPRVRLAILTTRDNELPEPLLEEHAPLDYTIIEAMNDVHFVAMDHDPLEELLLLKCSAAVRAEVWGELYIHEHLGIHQIHSRRGSCAVSRDIIGRDGGLRLYYRDGVAELLMFKFCGQ